MASIVDIQDVVFNVFARPALRVLVERLRRCGYKSDFYILHIIAIITTHHQGLNVLLDVRAPDPAHARTRAR